VRWEYIEKNWAYFRGKVEGIWGLSDKEFDFINGDRERLIKVLEKKKRYSRVQAEKEVNDFSMTVIGKGVTWTEARGA
jgi:hypothetical protein